MKPTFDIEKVLEVLLAADPDRLAIIIAFLSPEETSIIVERFRELATDVLNQIEANSRAALAFVGTVRPLFAAEASGVDPLTPVESVGDIPVATVSLDSVPQTFEAFIMAQGDKQFTVENAVDWYFESPVMNPDPKKEERGVIQSRVSARLVYHKKKGVVTNPSRGVWQYVPGTLDKKQLEAAPVSSSEFPEAPAEGVPPPAEVLVETATTLEEYVLTHGEFTTKGIVDFATGCASVNTEHVDRLIMYSRITQWLHVRKGRSLKKIGKGKWRYIKDSDLAGHRGRKKAAVPAIDSSAKPDSASTTSPTAAVEVLKADEDLEKLRLAIDKHRKNEHPTFTFVGMMKWAMNPSNYYATGCTTEVTKKAKLSKHFKELEEAKEIIRISRASKKNGPARWKALPLPSKENETPSPAADAIAPTTPSPAELEVPVAATVHVVPPAAPPTQVIVHPVTSAPVEIMKSEVNSTDPAEIAAREEAVWEYIRDNPGVAEPQIIEWSKGQAVFTRVVKHEASFSAFVCGSLNRLSNGKRILSSNSSAGKCWRVSGARVTQVVATPSKPQTPVIAPARPNGNPAKAAPSLKADQKRDALVRRLRSLPAAEFKLDQLLALLQRDTVYNPSGLKEARLRDPVLLHLDGLRVVGMIERSDRKGFWRMLPALDTYQYNSANSSSGTTPAKSVAPVVVPSAANNGKSEPSSPLLKLTPVLIALIYHLREKHSDTFAANAIFHWAAHDGDFNPGGLSGEKLTQHVSMQLHALARHNLLRALKRDQWEKLPELHDCEFVSNNDHAHDDAPTLSDIETAIFNYIVAEEWRNDGIGDTELLEWAYPALGNGESYDDFVSSKFRPVIATLKTKGLITFDREAFLYQVVPAKVSV